MTFILCFLFHFTFGAFSFVCQGFLPFLRGRGRLVLQDVGPPEEAGEQHEVGSVHEEGNLDIVIGNVALVACLFHLVRPNVDGGAHHHLEELGSGDAHGDPAWHAEFQGLEGVVAVHDTVHQVVHADEPAGSGDVVGVGVPGVQENGHVMVPVEEDEGLFPQHDEHCVSQLWNFAQREHPVPETSHAVVQETARYADGVMEAMIAQDIEKFRRAAVGSPHGEKG